MSNETESGMTMSTDTEAVLLAVKSRIAAIPVGKTLIDTITDADWLDESVDGWMINVESGSVEEADESDDMGTQVAKAA